MKPKSTTFVLCRVETHGVVVACLNLSQKADAGRQTAGSQVARRCTVGELVLIPDIFVGRYGKDVTPVSSPFKTTLESQPEAKARALAARDEARAQAARAMEVRSNG